MRRPLVVLAMLVGIAAPTVALACGFPGWGDGVSHHAWVEPLPPLPPAGPPAGFDFLQAMLETGSPSLIVVGVVVMSVAATVGD